MTGARLALLAAFADAEKWWAEEASWDPYSREAAAASDECDAYRRALGDLSGHDMRVLDRLRREGR